MERTTWRTVTGCAGIAFVILFLAAELSLADSPSLDASAAEIRAFFHSNATLLPVAYWSVLVSFGLVFLLFASGLRSLFGSADASHAGIWARLSYAGAVVLVAISGAHSGYWMVLSQETILNAISDDAVLAIAPFETIMLTTVIEISIAAFLVGSSAVILHSGIMSKWLGWLGMGTAALLLVGPLWIVGGDPENALGVVGLVGFLGWIVWILWASISLLLSAREVGSIQSAPPSSP